MNRDEAAAFQAVGIRIETFDEDCGWCGRPSTYVRAEDRYHHKCDTPNLPCWLALSQGRDLKLSEPVATQRKVSHGDSPTSRRHPGRRVSRRELRAQAFADVLT